jgi:hypothetical protein
MSDSIFALIAETAWLDALSLAATNRGNEIFDTLPEDIRKGRVQISFSGGDLGRLLQRGGFTSEADLHQWVAVHRRFATVLARLEVKRGRLGVEDLAAEEAEFDRQIGLDQALAQFRAGLEEIKAAREASGCEAHYREAEDLGRRAGEVDNQICNTKPVTLTGAIAMLEWGHEGGCCDERLNNAVIAGLRELVSLREAPANGGAQPEVIGFGEPDERP